MRNAILLCIITILCSCQNYNIPTLFVAEKSFVFESTSSEITFSIQSNTSWEIVSSDNWCEVIPNKGSGDGIINVSVTSNDTFSERVTDLNILSGLLKHTINVTQKQNPGLILKQRSDTIGYEGGVINLEVLSNLNYQISIPENVDWIALTSTKSLNVNKYILSISANNTYSKREAEIVLKEYNGTLTDTFTVFQKQNSAIIISPKYITVNSIGEQISVEMLTNIEVEIAIPKEVNWIRQIATKALSSSIINFIVDKNDNYENRKANIVFKDKKNSISDTLKILQKQKDTIYVVQRHISVPSSGATRNIEVIANVEYEQIISPEYSWISFLSTKSVNSDNYVISIAPNLLFTERNAKIVFKGKNSYLADTTFLTQEPKNTFSLSKNFFKVQKEGGTISFTVISNIEYSFKTIGEAGWVTGFNAKSLDTKNYIYTVKPNDSGSDRDFKIIFSHSLGNDTIFITQFSYDGYYAKIDNGSDMNLTVPVSVRPAIKRLKIEGILQMRDFDLIKESFKNLEYLDLTLAKLPNDGLPARAFKASEGVPIPLKNIILPNNITSIGEESLYGCNSLNEVLLEEGIMSIGERAFFGCTSLIKVVSKITNPPSLLSSFSGIHPMADLIVPVGKVSVYKETIGWGYDFFSRIYEQGTNPVDELYLSSGMITSSGKPKSFEVTIYSSGEWIVHEKPEWINISPLSGYGETKVKIELNSFVSEEIQRNGRVRFQLSKRDLVADLSVKQYNFTFDDGDFLKVRSSTQGNGIDIVFIGDGYSFDDVGNTLYTTDLNRAINYFFDVEPYKTYKDYFNVYIVYAISEESGIGNNVINVRTTFNTKYNSPESRALTTNEQICFNYASKAPLSSGIEETLVVLIANSNNYGGTTILYENGQSIAICAKSDLSYPYDFRGIVQHEAGGHGFGKLADEYITNYTTIGESRKNLLRYWQGYSHFKNVDLTDNLTEILWKHFIGETGYSNVGAFEGGYYYQLGIWKPELYSMMINNIEYFNAPSRELIVKRIKLLAGEAYSFGEFKSKDVSQLSLQTKSMGGSIDPIKILPPPILRSMNR